MYKAIIFDCNGVFAINGIEENLETFSKEFGFDKELLLPEYLKVEEQTISGELTSLEACRQLLDKFEIAADPKVLREVWVDTYVGVPNTEMIKFAHEISKELPIYLFSNHSDLFPDVSKKLRLDKLFKKENIFISSEMKMLKPNKEAFLFILNAIGLRPEEVVFVDDNPRNIRAAEEIETKGILFDNVSQLKADLAKIS